MADLEGTLSGGLHPEAEGGAPAELTNPLAQLQTELSDIDAGDTASLERLNAELASIGEGVEPPADRPVPPRPGVAQTFFSTLAGGLSGSPQLARAIENTLQRGELANTQAEAQNEVTRLQFEHEQRGKRFTLATTINERLLNQQVRSGELKEAAATMKAQDRLERDRKIESEDLERESTKMRIQEQMRADLELIQARGVQKRTTAQATADVEKLQNAYGVPREVARLMDNVTQGAMDGAKAEVTSKGNFALLKPGEAAVIFQQATNRSIQVQARIARMFHAGELDPSNPPADLLLTGGRGGGGDAGRGAGDAQTGASPTGGLSAEDIAEIERLGRE